MNKKYWLYVLNTSDVIRYTANEKPRQIPGIFDITAICRQICQQYADISPKFKGLPMFRV